MPTELFAPINEKFIFLLIDMSGKGFAQETNR